VIPDDLLVLVHSLTVLISVVISRREHAAFEMLCLCSVITGTFQVNVSDVSPTN
jgi:predicted RNA-binding protein with EMAP domain